MARKSKNNQHIHILVVFNLIFAFILMLMMGKAFISTWTRADALPFIGFTQKQGTFDFTVVQKIDPQPGPNCKPESNATGSQCKCLPYEWEIYSCSNDPAKLQNWLTKQGKGFFAQTCDKADYFKKLNNNTELCKKVLDMRIAQRISEETYLEKKNNPLCSRWCVGKPVIYLYPEHTMAVDVVLDIPGRIYESIPEYPAEGWLNVIAHPNGQLEYKGKQYWELYYEDELHAPPQAPKTGIIIPISQLEAQLDTITTRLGLKQKERAEFLQYWIPKLTALNQPYILFSIFEQSEKDRIDTVNISPKPNTFINFIAYFKALRQPIAIAPLSISPSPARIGFTAVEWGGVIDPD